MAMHCYVISDLIRFRSIFFLHFCVQFEMTESSVKSQHIKCSKFTMNWQFGGSNSVRNFSFCFHSHWNNSFEWGLQVGSERESFDTHALANDINELINVMEDRLGWRGVNNDVWRWSDGGPEPHIGRTAGIRRKAHEKSKTFSNLIVFDEANVNGASTPFIRSSFIA